MTRDELEGLRELAETTLRLGASVYSRQGKLAHGVLALLADQEGRGWQPLSTAPEGTVVLFCTMSPEAAVSNWCFVDWQAGGKLMLHPKWHATHWMPLPAPPKEA